MLTVLPLCAAALLRQSEDLDRGLTRRHRSERRFHRSRLGEQLHCRRRHDAERALGADEQLL